MDETTLICSVVIPEFGTLTVGIDFLIPALKETKRKKSSGPLSNGDTTSWRFTLAKEINETLFLKCDLSLS